MPGKQILMTERTERGFTLLEAIAVLLIIGVLSAIGIGSARTITTQSQLRQAEASLQRAIASQRTYAASNGVWASPGDVPPMLGLILTEEVSQGPGEASIAAGPQGTLGVAVRAAEGTCLAYSLEDPLDTAYAQRVTVKEESPCSGGGALAGEPEEAAEPSAP